MSVERVTGPADPRVAEYRDVAGPELIRSRGLFVAEGRLVLSRLIAAGRYRLRSVLVSEAAYGSLQEVLAGAGEGVPVYVCRAGDLAGITGHDFHRGCLALAERPPATTWHDLLQSLEAACRAPAPRADAFDPAAGVTPVRAPHLLVVLEGVTNADNIGGVFRNAAAFGAGAVFLSPTCGDPLYRKAIRTSMAAALLVPCARMDDWPHDLARLRGRGYTIAALSPREPAIALDVFAALPPSSPIALLVGTEGSGLTPDAESAADVRVRIPITAAVDSLNLAVAVGIALQRLSSGHLVI